MKTAARLTIALVALLALAGCAEQDNGGTTGRSGTGPTSPGADGESSQDPQPRGTSTPTPGESGGKEATSVTVRVTGGLRGVDGRLVYAGGAPPPPGHTKADVAAVLKAASAPELISAQLAKVPAETCCDRQSYAVTVQYDNGSQRTYTSLDGVEQPTVFEKFLGML